MEQNSDPKCGKALATLRDVEKFLGWKPQPYQKQMLAALIEAKRLTLFHGRRSFRIKIKFL